MRTRPRVALTINSQTINTVVLYELCDPVVVSRLDGGIFGLEVGKRHNSVSKPAMLDTGIVAEVDWVVGVVL